MATNPEHPDGGEPPQGEEPAEADLELDPEKVRDLELGAESADEVKGGQPTTTVLTRFVSRACP